MATGGQNWNDPRENGDLPDVYLAMGQIAENVADLTGITRAEQDEFGVRSQTWPTRQLPTGSGPVITLVTLRDRAVW